MELYNIDARDIDHVLINEEEIAECVDAIAKQIDKDVEALGGELLLVCVLKGSLIFTSDLARKIKTPLKIDFIKASSYGSGTVSGGNLKISLDVGSHDWDKKFVVIVEDIIDSGNTLSKLIKYFKDKGATRVKTCTLLDKPERREVDLAPDYCGRSIPNEFVVGYGLDVAESYRELPFVGVLKPEVIKKYIG
jgi:hypoxanthine phosphoribosyltransferase